ncbi:DUF5677 domain-containing protein [Streptomyces yangpuensis]|uniref:DUF5677 domain-containing protein n=1 Tax=Streptomyces yangpuensis TaxID=1648182 RepID=UPI000629115C|nr:DUF5677 domain-containing protein [Streptomyces yangpuensis]
MDQEQWLRIIDDMAATAIRRAPRTLHRIGRRRQLFERRLRRHWGRSLDLCLLTFAQAEELGSELSHLTPTPCDMVTAALIQLHARACRAADEVYCLLSAGHGQGAMKPARLLYELAAVTSVIGTYGRRPGHEDLVERYYAHEDCAGFKAMEIYQEYAQDLGMEPYSDEEVEEARQASQAAVDRFGPGIRSQVGWAAAPLASVGARVSTRGLASLADLAHLHPYFEWASAETHAGAQGMRLNRADTRRGPVLQTGPSVVGLADPAYLAVKFICHITHALVEHSQPEPGPQFLLGVAALHKLQMRTHDALEAALRRTRDLPLIG